MIRRSAEFRHPSGSSAPVTGARWPIFAVLSVLIVASSYLAAVRTTTGQAWENAALRGSDQVTNKTLVSAAAAWEDAATLSIVVATVLVALVGLVRRRPRLAVAGVGAIVLAEVITQALKRFILPRPLLVSYIGDHSPNSFPSGHTTIAMAVLFAAIIVMPYRWRDVTVLVLLPWAWAMGAFTLIVRWHRVSDVIGAGAVALLCACLASWWLDRRGDIRRHPGPARPGGVILVGVLVALTLMALVLGGFLWGVPVLEGVDLSHPEPGRDYSAYLGAQALTAAFPALAALTFLGLWHRLET